MAAAHTNSIGVLDSTNWRGDVWLPAREAAGLVGDESRPALDPRRYAIKVTDLRAFAASVLLDSGSSLTEAALLLSQSDKKRTEHHYARAMQARAHERARRDVLIDKGAGPGARLDALWFAWAKAFPDFIRGWAWVPTTSSTSKYGGLVRETRNTGGDESMGVRVSEENDLLIVAVSRFADTCGPALHPDCPFSRPQGAELVCGRECRSIAATLTRPRSSDGAVEIPFDAEQALMLSRDLSLSPTSAWSATALLTALRKVAKSRAILRDGGEDLRRIVDGTSAFAMLDQLGLDPRELLSHALGSIIVEALDSVLMVVRFHSEDGALLPPRIEELCRVREAMIPAAGGGDPFSSLVPSPEFRRRVMVWIQEASVEEVLAWQLPSTLPQAIEGPPGAEGGDEYQWVLDRLTQTYLGDWDRVSLELEYRYTCEGLVPERIPHAVMRERMIPAAKVTREIARRSVTGGDNDRHAVAALTERATEAIEDGHIDIAAAVFETARQMNPSSAELANNHGFCLLPESPSGALEAFEDARRKGLTGPLLAANIALAYLQLGRADLALQECQHAAEGGLKSGGSAWLWEFDDQLGLQPRLTMMDPTKYLGLVALRSASALDDAEAIEWWRSFVEVPNVIDQREGPIR